MTEDLTNEQKLRKLNKLKKEIDEAEAEKNQKIGERNGILSRLRQQFKFDDIKKAKQRTKAIEETIMRRNKKIDEGFKILIENYEL